MKADIRCRIGSKSRADQQAAYLGSMYRLQRVPVLMMHVQDVCAMHRLHAQAAQYCRLHLQAA